MRKQQLYIFTIIFQFITMAVSADDGYLWLEEVEGKQALEWVNTHNAITEKSLGNDPLYDTLYAEALEILSRTDKLPKVSIKGNWVYNLRKTDANPRGLYQRTKMIDFVAGKPQWQTVINIDKLSNVEATKWVFRSMTCLEPLHEKCMLSLAPGGSDASVIREFDPNLGRFVEGGFELPLAKTNLSWLTENELLVATNFGSGSLTTSGYPRIQKIWRRGTALDQAEMILEVAPESVAVSPSTYQSSNDTITVLSDGVSFWNRQYYQLTDAQLKALKLPLSAVIEGFYKDSYVVSLKSDWQFQKQTYAAGSILLAKPETLQKGIGEVIQLATQTQQFIVKEVKITASGIAVVAMEDVKSSLYFFANKEGKWSSQKVNLPATGKIEFTGSNDSHMIIRYEDFLTPPTLYAVDYGLNTSVVMQQSATFDNKDMEAKQFFTRSADGTRVPYFVVKNKHLKLDGKNPTHIFSYGGFRNALQPSYSGSYEDHNGAYGKLWLARGGVFVLANIRGGGEYGPEWHAAALKEKRPRSFEDFEAIAEDLIKRNITSSDHLSIEGRSQGGFLVGALMTRRPNLYNVVVCGVPLLDMKRYNKLLAGASWMAEYGNPDTDDWNFIKQFSPYQNLKTEVDYPSIFFFTSTRDDRVHPGHARKMAAKMKSMGQVVEYYENTEGGHVGSATAEQTAKRIALSYTHLWRQSGDNR